MRPDLVLRLPTLAEEPSFLAAHQATSPGYPSFLHFYEPHMSLEEYLSVLERVRHGRDGNANAVVPETFLFAFAGDRIVGRTAIRHTLTPSLAQVGGHIGYVVVPAYRRQGYATEILRLSLRIAREAAGLHRVLVTCDADNVGSLKAIERNGGILENVIVVPDRGVAVRRYWMEART
jgi:predicted acetyltransferase